MHEKTFFYRFWDKKSCECKTNAKLVRMQNWSCMIWSNLLLLLCIAMSIYIKCGWAIDLITVGAAVSLILNSPIDKVNRELDREEHHRYKKITTVFLLIFVE
ncbi:MAG: hypothetical protein HFI50_14505 [Lachnospiraceae bacterium]|nr:hypothetical protein [Lachnospiraceae bacterium]